MKGRTPTPIIAYESKCSLGTIYSSMTGCANLLGLQVSHVSEVCSGKRRQHKGYLFKKYKEAKND